MAQGRLKARREEAEQLIQDFALYKGAIVACNPLFVVDVIGGTVADLLLVRSLARLYDLPMTSHEAGKLLRTIFVSAGGLLLGETLGNALFGGGSWDSWREDFRDSWAWPSVKGRSPLQAVTSWDKRRKPI